MVYIIQTALQVDDVILHVALFDWMVEKNKVDKLINVTQPSLELYLTRKAEQQPDSVQISELQWRYFEISNKHEEAAKILIRLAKKPGYVTL